MTFIDYINQNAAFYNLLCTFILALITFWYAYITLTISKKTSRQIVIYEEQIKQLYKPIIVITTPLLEDNPFYTKRVLPILLENIGNSCAVNLITKCTIIDDQLQVDSDIAIKVQFIKSGESKKIEFTFISYQNKFELNKRYMVRFDILYSSISNYYYETVLINHFITRKTNDTSNPDSELLLDSFENKSIDKLEYEALLGKITKKYNTIII